MVQLKPTVAQRSQEVCDLETKLFWAIPGLGSPEGRVAKSKICEGRPRGTRVPELCSPTVETVGYHLSPAAAGSGDVNSGLPGKFRMVECGRVIQSATQPLAQDDGHRLRPAALDVEGDEEARSKSGEHGEPGCQPGQKLE